MQVHFDANHIFDSVEVQKELKEYYERLITILSEQILLPEFLDEVEAIFIPEDFISAVMVFQEEHGMGTPSVTNNSFGRAYGKMLHDSATGKYYVFIDSSVASMIMDDQVFDSFFSRGDEKSYLAAKQARSMGLNILAHELSHVEFAIRVKRPESEKSLHSGLIQHGFILLDEYFACRRATAFSKYSLADGDEKFIQDLECRTEEDRWAYKTGKIDLNHFCSLFHSYTEMALIRLASVIGANHSMGSDHLPFPKTKVGRYAHVLREEFDLLYASILSGANVSISEEVINAIHSYFVDMGVRIEDTTQGLYYHVPD